MRRTTIVFLLSSALAALGASAGEISGAILQLETFTPFRPDQVSEAAPVRFALYEDGQVFIGGTSVVFSGRLDKKEIQDLEKSVAAVRKLKGLGSSVSFGPGAQKSLLRLRKGRAVDISTSGDPAAAPSTLKPLANLLARLESFDHPSLRPWKPESFWGRAREQKLVGGCRSWSLSVPLASLLATGASLSYEQVRDWPQGASPASVCDAGRNYVVSFRPLLPGEHP